MFAILVTPIFSHIFSRLVSRLFWTTYICIGVKSKNYENTEIL
jgi:hypothetical protein